MRMNIKRKEEKRSVADVSNFLSPLLTHYNSLLQCIYQKKKLFHFSKGQLYTGKRAKSAALKKIYGRSSGVVSLGLLVRPALIRGGFQRLDVGMLDGKTPDVQIVANGVDDVNLSEGKKATRGGSAIKP